MALSSPSFWRRRTSGFEWTDFSKCYIYFKFILIWLVHAKNALYALNPSWPRKWIREAENAFWNEMRRFVPTPAIVNKFRKHQLKRTKTVKYSFVQRQIMVFLFGIKIVLVVDLIAMELLCCMTATIFQSFWCQFWFGLQPFWFGISFSCQQNEWNWLKRTFSQPRWSSQVLWGGERPSGRPPAREWITLKHACSFFGREMLDMKHLERTSSGLNQNIARGTGRLIDV